MNYLKLIQNKILQLPLLFWCCVLLGGIWWGVHLFTYGIFSDGIFYSTIARNLAFDAQATIWDLKVSNALDRQFNGHPPFAFWIQALFFKLIGDYFWVEKAYSLLLALTSIYFTHKVWKLVNSHTSFELPIFIWLCIPSVGWSFSNNMLENSLTLLSINTIWIQLRWMKGQQGFYTTIITTSLLFAAALLTKGLVALFPLAVPVVYLWLWNRKKLCLSLIYIVVICISLVILFGLLFYVSPRGLEFIQDYFALQFGHSFQNFEVLTWDRFYLIKIILELLAIPLIITFIIRILYKERISLPHQTLSLSKEFIFWMAIGLSASLPMLISPKQLGFYIVPSMLYYSLGIASLVLPFYQQLCKDNLYTQLSKMLKRVVLFCTLICFAFMIKNYKSISRDKDILHDTFAIGKTFPSTLKYGCLGVCINIGIYTDISTAIST